MPLVRREHGDPLEERVRGLFQEVADEVNNLTRLDRLGDVAGVGIFVGIPQRSVDCSGADGGDEDVVGNKFLGEGVAEAHHAVLGCTVACLSIDSTDACHRGDVDDASLFAWNHVLEDGVCAVHRALQIAIDNAVDAFERLLGEGNVLNDSGIVHEYLDGAVIRFQIANACGKGGGVPHIDRAGNDVSTEGTR